MQPTCRSAWRTWRGRASICPKADPQSRCRLTAVAMKFAEVYGNIYGNIEEGLFESESLPKDCTSPNNRLTEFTTRRHHSRVSLDTLGTRRVTAASKSAKGSNAGLTPVWSAKNPIAGGMIQETP